MSTEITKSLTLFEQLEMAESVGTLHVKGYKNKEIAEICEISQVEVKRYISEYLNEIQRQIDDDPYFLEKYQFNTLKIMKELDEISSEAWETVKVATNEGLVTGRLQALKLALEVSTKKAQLQQLLGTGAGHGDTEYIARMQKAEQVNALLSKVMKDVVSDCENCRSKARILLAEAFSLMDVENAEGEEVIVE